LRQAGLQPGERVAIMLPTSEAFFAVFFGVLYAGGVPTPIYPPARPSQIEEHLKRQAGILRNARAVLLIAAREASAVARLLKLQVETLRAVISQEELSQGPGSWKLKVQADSTALLQYTSGSTGDPKGVVLSHSNMLANIRAMGEAMEAGPDDVFVSWLPLYHDMGLIGAWLGSLYFAAPLVVMSPLTFLVRPEQWLWAIHRHRATLSASPNFGFGLAGYHPSFRGTLRQVWLPAGSDGTSLRSGRECRGISLSTAGTAPDHRSHRSCRAHARRARLACTT
jgi:acyl-CoA synthetase (AMP-forming)/AMP-acid ligase II